MVKQKNHWTDLRLTKDEKDGLIIEHVFAFFRKEWLICIHKIM